MINHISIKQAAKISGYSRPWIQHLCHTGKLLTIKFDGRFAIDEESIKKYMKDVASGKINRGRPKKC